MKRTSFALIAASVLAGFTAVMPSGAAAETLSYECDITNRDPRVDWISLKLALVIQDDGSAVVIDSIILAFVEKPLPVKVRERGGKLRMSWTLNNAKDSKGVRVPSFNFVAVITKATNGITLRANPVRHQQNWKGSGSCKVRTDGKLPKILR